MHLKSCSKRLCYLCYVLGSPHPNSHPPPPPPPPLQAFQMLRELHMSVQGNVSTSASSNSLSQPVGVNPPGSGGGVNGTPDGEDDEVAFDVKIEGISGEW